MVVKTKNTHENIVHDDEDIVSRLITGKNIEKISKDMREANKLISQDEAKFLVKAYYNAQVQRKRLNSQIKMIGERGNPIGLLIWFAKQQEIIEKQIAIGLDVYSYNHPVGKWMRGMKGIGPVLAAGLLAHIDITKAPTAGHIWSFAGLATSIKWKSSDFIRGMVEAGRKADHDDMEILYDICHTIVRKPLDILHGTGAIETLPSVEDATLAVQEVLGQEFVPQAMFHADNVIKEAFAPHDKEKILAVYKKLLPDGLIFNWEDLVKRLAKRPWNTELKTLCWKIEESFRKNSGERAGFYGLQYRKKKESLVEANMRGDNADEALRLLKEKKYGRDTDAYYWYSGEWVNNPKFNPQAVKGVTLVAQPRFSPAHIDSMAIKHAVRLFLSHVHEKLYIGEYGRRPALPYAIAILGHAHIIEAPEAEKDI